MNLQLLGDGDRWGVSDQYVHTAVFKTENQQKFKKPSFSDKKKKQYGNLNSLSRKQKHLPKDFSYITARLSTSE